MIEIDTFESSQQFVLVKLTVLSKQKMKWKKLTALLKRITLKVYQNVIIKLK